MHCTVAGMSAGVIGEIVTDMVTIGRCQEGSLDWVTCILLPRESNIAQEELWLELQVEQIRTLIWSW